MTFRFPVRGRRIPDVPGRLQFPPVAEAELLPDRIQGKVASDIEARVALALYKLRVNFEFQVRFFGGRLVPGGLVLDFLVYNPLPMAIMIQGEYYHKGEQRNRDALAIARIAAYFHGQIEILEIFGKDLQTQEEADRFVRQRVLGR